MTLLLEEIKPPLNELAHHGVKGMHWGVRRHLDTPAGSSSEKKTPASTPSTHHSLSSKQKKILIGASAAAGVVAAGYLLHRYGNVKIKDLGSTIRRTPKPSVARSEPSFIQGARKARASVLNSQLSRAERAPSVAEAQKNAERVASFYRDQLQKNQTAAMLDQNLALNILKNSHI